MPSSGWCRDRMPIEPGDLDAGDLRDRLQQAESDLESAEDESEAKRTAERSKKRYEAFLEIAEGGGSS